MAANHKKSRVMQCKINIWRFSVIQVVWVPGGKKKGKGKRAQLPLKTFFCEINKRKSKTYEKKPPSEGGTVWADCLRTSKGHEIAKSNKRKKHRYDGEKTQSGNHKCPAGIIRFYEVLMEPSFWQSPSVLYPNIKWWALRWGVSDHLFISLSRWVWSRLHQRTQLCSKSNQRNGGKDHGAAQNLQVLTYEPF